MTATQPEVDAGKAVVLYDGQCRLCQRSVALLRRLDWRGRLAFRDARDPSGRPTSPAPLKLDRLLFEMHVVTPDRRRVFAGFDAFRWIAGRLPALWLLVPLLYVPGVPTLGRRIYLWVAKNRYNLVPCADGQCALPRR
jgi:predicted DCC family thiol-disulfide oxidoreductase YuxK